MGIDMVMAIRMDRKKKTKVENPVQELEVVTAEIAVVGDNTIVAVNQNTDGWLVLPERKPLFDSGFTLPSITEPSKLSFDSVVSSANQLDAEGNQREFVPIRMGNHRFVQWLDTLEGNLRAEQARLDKQGNGVQIYVVMEGNFFIDPNLEWTVSRKGQKASV